MSIAKIRTLLIPLLIIFNIFGVFFESVFGLSRQIFVFVILLAMVGLLTFKKKLHINKYMLLLILFQIGVCAFHVLFGSDIASEIKMFLYFFVFWLIGIFYEPNDFKRLENTLILVSIIMIIEAIYYYFILLMRGWRTFNVRLFTTAPKEDYTFILTLVFVLLFFRFLYSAKNNKEKICLLILMAMECFVNIIIMQSKTMILVIAFVFIAAIFISKRTVKRKLINILAIVGLAIVFVFIFASEYVPDFMYVFINKVTGLFESKVATLQDADLYSGTYGQRSTIYIFAINLILKYPLFGIGFGQFGVYSAQSKNELISAVVQAESGVMGAFVEGGIIYGSIFVLLLIIPFFKGISLYKKKADPNILTVSMLSSAFFILALTNDCTSITFWLILAMVYARYRELKKRVYIGKLEEINRGLENEIA